MADIVNITQVDNSPVVLTVEVQGPSGTKGDQGIQGPIGPANTLTVGTVDRGDDPSITITGDAPNQVLNVVLPKGDQGVQGIQGIQGPLGPANTLTIGAVDSAVEAGATITGTAPNQVLNLTLPAGPANELSIGTVSQALVPSATITGAYPNQQLNLVMPQGAGTFAGGTTGQVLTKKSNSDFDLQWESVDSAATPSTVVVRDAAGRAQVVDPIASADAATKNYVDVANVAMQQSVNNVNDRISDARTTPTPSKLMTRDATGRSQVADPQVADDITTKRYVDAADAVLQSHIDTNSTNIASNTSTLNAAVSAPTPGVLVKRDANGRAQVADPSANNDVANKHYVDAADTALQTQITANGTAITNNATAIANNTTAIGNNTSTLNAAASAATPSVLVKRDASGRVQAADPSVAADVATKNYVDSTASGLQGQITTNATNVASNATTISSNAAKLNAATNAPTASTLVARDANSRAQVAAPAVAADIANKGYVDAKVVGPQKLVITPTLSRAAGNSYLTKTNFPAAGYHCPDGDMTYGSKIFVAGLLTSGATYMYDPAADTYSTTATLPYYQYGAAGGWINGLCYMAQGYSADSTNATIRYYGGVRYYDPVANTWTQKTAVSTNGRRYVAGAVLNNQLWVIGGANATAYNNTNEVYDPLTDTWTVKAPLPIALYGATATAVNGMIYVFGGYSPTVLGTVYMYNPQTDSWTTKSPMPTARYFARAIYNATTGRIYVLGGTTGSVTAIAEAYDPVTDTWYTGYSFTASARYGFAVGQFNDRLYGICGFTTVSSTVNSFLALWNYSLNPLVTLASPAMVYLGSSPWLSGTTPQYNIVNVDTGQTLSASWTQIITGDTGHRITISMTIPGSYDLTPWNIVPFLGNVTLYMNGGF